MKNWINFLFSVVLVLGFFSCTEQVLIPEEGLPVEIIGKPLNDGLVSIKVTPGGVTLKSGTVSDTVSTEKWLKTTYQAIAATNLTIASWQWSFAENNAKATGATIDFWHGLDPGAKTSVTLIGVEANGTAHTATVWVRIVYSLDGMPGFIMVSKTAITGGSFNYVFAAHKKGMQGVKGTYGYTGTVTSPTWQVVPIAAADTNFNYVNGVLVPASVGDVGKYVAVRTILYPGEYEIHAGHIDTAGKLVWGNFWSFYKDGKFTVATNGDLSGLITTGVPGISGDPGVNSIVRKDILATSVIVYTKYATAFTKGFIQLQNADGTWRAPIAEVAVTGYPNWGKVEIPYTSFPTPEILVFRFGANIDTPNVFSADMPLSTYWDTMFQVLRMKNVKLGN